jgi:hypothetical protein
MRRWFGFSTVAIGVLGMVVTSAEAGSYPDRRAGHTLVSANLGGGSGQANHPDEGFDSSRYGAFVVEAQFGYCLSDAVLLSGQGSLWTRNINGANVYLGDLLAAGTYFVASSGLFLKAGIGLGIADAQIWVGPTPVTASKTGLAYMGAIGYEYRTSPTLGVGPQFDYHYYSLSDNLDINFWSITLAFNWYF